MGNVPKRRVTFLFRTQLAVAAGGFLRALVLGVITIFLRTLGVRKLYTGVSSELVGGNRGETCKKS